MGFVSNQIVGMMVNKIKQNNPKMGKYLDEIQRGGNANQILGEAIKNGDINKMQFESAKTLLQRYGKQMGINIQEGDLRALESLFDTNNGNSSGYDNYQNKNNGGFRF